MRSQRGPGRLRVNGHFSAIESSWRTHCRHESLDRRIASLKRPVCVAADPRWARGLRRRQRDAAGPLSRRTGSCAHRRSDQLCVPPWKSVMCACRSSKFQRVGHYHPVIASHPRRRSDRVSEFAKSVVGQPRWSYESCGAYRPHIGHVMACKGLFQRYSSQPRC
jgi:hypothetical protein